MVKKIASIETSRAIYKMLNSKHVPTRRVVLGQINKIEIFIASLYGILVNLENIRKFANLR